MSNSETITRILALSDPPDPKGYRRYLETLPPRQLNERAALVEEQQTKPQRASSWFAAPRSRHGLVTA